MRLGKLSSLRDHLHVALMGSGLAVEDVNDVPAMR
jgi:hypothetical protein